MTHPKRHRSRSGQPPVILASAGRQALAVTRGLGEQGVRVIVAHWDEDDLAGASRHASETIMIPAPDSGDDAFIERLFDLVQRFPGAVLIPTTDGAVKDVARHKRELERYSLVECPDWDVAESFIDKRHTYELAEQLGIPAPRTLIPNGPEDLDSFSDRVEYPCLIKPRESHLWAAKMGGKFTLVQSPSELKASYAAAAELDLEVMIQEHIPGPDRHSVNHNAYRTAAGVVAECTARKLRQAPPREGLPRVVLAADIPEIIEPGRALLEGLGLEGFACTEFKLDPRDHTYKLLEVNGRYNVSSLLSIRSGRNFPWIAYRFRVDGTAPSDLPPPRTGLYWIDEWAELAFNRSRRGRDGESWRQIIRPWVRNHTFSVFDPRDLGPFKLVAGDVVQDAARIARRRLGSPPAASL